MSKSRASTDARQFDLFTAARPVTGPAAHAGVEAWASAAVGQVLKEDPRSREEIAGAMAASMGEEFGRPMLDKYASPASDQHNISFGRAIALAAVTSNFLMFEEAVRRLGGTVLWGDEIHAARLGHLQAQADQIAAEMKKLRSTAQPIERNRAK